MSDTCRLFPLFGDTWPSCLLPSQEPTWFWGTVLRTGSRDVTVCQLDLRGPSRMLACRVIPFFFVVFIYLSMVGLSCGTRDPWSSLQRRGSFNWGVWTLSCGLRDLVPWPGIEPASPALGAWSLSHWTTRGVLQMLSAEFIDRLYSQLYFQL